MIVDIYNFKNYIKYLEKKISVESKKTKGLKLKIAKGIGCHPSYLSQILSKKVNLNLEQAVRVNTFFMHDEDESKYFIWLVELARAGTKELKQFFKQQLDEITKKRLDISNRVKDSRVIANEHQYKYYSSWFYSAIYVSLAVEKYRNPVILSEKFNLPIGLVHEVLQFLIEIGLIEKTKKGYVHSKKNLHLSRENVFIQRHHINWRSKALQSVETNLFEDLHYSSVLAIHPKDFERLKKLFVDCIASSKKIIAPSKEEEVYALTLDLFNLY